MFTIAKCLFKKSLNILVLGYYDRANTGDEMYKVIFPYLFPVKNMIFACTDDMKCVPKDVDVIICGGGEIINSYFMKKINALIHDFHGQVYAFSVSLSHDEDVTYLHAFDHVFLRSKRDYLLAQKYIGAENCTFIPDAVFSLPFFKLSQIRQNKQQKKTITKIGICLAQPVFNAAPELVKQISAMCEKLLVNDPNNVQLYLFAFNHFSPNYNECDVIMNDNIVYNMHPDLRTKCSCVVAKDPLHVYEKLADMDVNLCMRYHSVVFSIIANVPFVAVYTSRKVDELLKDIDVYKGDELQHYKITESNIDIDRIVSLVQHALTIQACTTTNKNQDNTYKYENYIEKIRDMILFSRKQKDVRNSEAQYYREKLRGGFEDVLNYVRMLIARYLDLDINGTNKNDEKIIHSLLYDTGPLLLSPSPQLQQQTSSIIHEDLARLICYAITSSISHPCLWGLIHNMQSSKTFRLCDAIKYIYDHHAKEVISSCAKPQSSLSTMNISNITPQFLRRCIVNIDPYFQNDFQNVHRSGWQFVTDTLMTIDAKSLSRTCGLIVDTYVDRTFLWGANVLKTVKAIPYTSPWIGFIHHTFEESHGPNNCKQLFKNILFQKSLCYCKGLIVMSQYLKNQIEAALPPNMENHVEVYVIYHPTEFVTANNKFTMERFLSNPVKYVTQIGAWLRNPYSIYALPFEPQYRNELGLRKAVLRGKQMDDSIKPTSLLLNLYMILHTPTRIIGDRDIANISRSNDTKEIGGTKYTRDLYKKLREQDSNVTILDHMENTEYDKFLTKNIVFLDLVDCSAVNTVIECIVRDTPIIVNRHPALEEVLGKKYPGFYETPLEAAMTLSKKKNIAHIHSYLKKLDKNKLKIETFMNQLMDIVTSISRK